MYQTAIQDIQQIRSICQQLSHTERQNVQAVTAQAGMQNFAYRESFAAQQLQHCVDLCNQAERTLSQVSFNQPGIAQTAFSAQPTQYTQPHAALQSVMQADRATQTQTVPRAYGYGAQNQYTSQSLGTSYGTGINTSALSQVMQADRQATQSGQLRSVSTTVFPRYSRPTGGITQTHSPALAQVMQADRIGSTWGQPQQVHSPYQTPYQMH